jgi:hypothetical protein
MLVGTRITPTPTLEYRPIGTSDLAASTASDILAAPCRGAQYDKDLVPYSLLYDPSHKMPAFQHGVLGDGGISGGSGCCSQTPAATSPERETQEGGQRVSLRIPKKPSGKSMLTWEPRSCAQCKARKSKCIRSELGSCQRCRMSGLPCEDSG